MEALPAVAAYGQTMVSLALAGELQGIWFWAAVYSLLLCGFSLRYQLRVRSWSSTRGRLLSAATETFGATAPLRAEQDYVLKARYQYEVDGEAYEGKRVSAWQVVASHNAKAILEQQLKGVTTYPPDGVRVFYNPKRPAKSFLVLPGYGGLAATLLFALAPLATYVLRFHA